MRSPLRRVKRLTRPPREAPKQPRFRLAAEVITLWGAVAWLPQKIASGSIDSRGDIWSFLFIGLAIIGAVMSYSETPKDSWSQGKRKFSKFVFGPGAWLVFLISATLAWLG